nr:uncharacterized protein LOC111843399 isoform X2 [Paramormyrops kingsleyae]
MTERRTGEPLDGRRGSLGVAYRCRLSPVTLGSGWRRSDGWQLTASAMDPVLCIHVAGRALSGHCEEDGSTYETRSPRPTTEGSNLTFPAHGPSNRSHNTVRCGSGRSQFNEQSPSHKCAESVRAP